MLNTILFIDGENFRHKVEDVVKVGDVIRVKVIKVENGKIGLSLKQAK